MGLGVTMKKTHGQTLCALMSSCAVICLPVLSPAMAQDAASTVVLDKVVVDGQNNDDETIVATEVTSDSKMPTDILDTAASVSVVTSQEIERRGATSTEQVLQYTPGVATDFYGSDDRFDFISVRGFSATTFIDGVYEGNPFGGVREEPYAYDRLELVKGANSTGFGASNPGGSINYVTKTATGERKYDTSATIGLHNHKELKADLGDSFDEAGVFSWRAVGKFQDADSETKHSQNDEKFFLGSFGFRPSEKTDFTLTFDYLDRDAVPGSGGYPNGYDFDRDAFLGEPDFNYLNTDRTQITAKLDQELTDELKLNATARFTDVENNFGYAYVSGIANAATTSAYRDFYANHKGGQSFIADANLLYDKSFALMDTRTLVGADFRRQYETSRTWYQYRATTIDWSNPVYTGGLNLANTAIYSGTQRKVETKAIYAQEELTIDDKIIANFGLRHDWIDTTERNLKTGAVTTGSDSETTFRAGLTYKLNDSFSMFGNYAQSAVAASTGVDPERGEQFEVGIKYRPDNMNALFTAAAYDLYRTNVNVTNPVTSQKETIGETRSFGFDLEAKAELTDNLSLTAGYSYVKTEVLVGNNGANEGNQLNLVPNHTASLWLDYKLTDLDHIGDISFGAGARYTGSYYIDLANTMKADAAVIFDAAVQYDISEKTNLALNVTNILDEKHVAYGGFGADFYNPGRDIKLTLNHSW